MTSVTQLLTIRCAIDADAAVIAAIIRTSFAEQAMLEPPSGAIRETESSVRERLETGTIALAALPRESIGCVYYEPQADHFYFGRLAVLPEQRSRGIAAALIAHVEQQARTQEFSRIRCGVRVALPHLRDRYERLGYRFVEARSHQGYIEPTWVILEKQLGTKTS